MGDGLFDLGHRGVSGKFAQRLHHRGQGEGHICSSIPVGNGVNIEIINDLFVAVQQPREGLHQCPKVTGTELIGRRHC